MTILSSEQVKACALALGFSHCGIAQAHTLVAERERFEHALSEGRHAGMRFLERDVERRFDPSGLLPNCRSVIVVLYNYMVKEEPVSDRYRTARYTWVEDYHPALSAMLEQLAEKLHIAPDHYRITVDSSCISEKNWAAAAGVGCYGKNGLIHNEEGSFFFIGILLTDFAVDNYDTFRNSDCGTCRICQDACPAKALQTPYSVDARRCFSYHTVENKIVDNESVKSSPLLFGCDICQEVCPKNKKMQPPSTSVLKSSLFLRLQNQEMENLSEEDFQHYFGNTAIARRKYQRFYRAIELKRNHHE